MAFRTYFIDINSYTYVPFHSLKQIKEKKPYWPGQDYNDLSDEDKRFAWINDEVVKRYRREGTVWIVEYYRQIHHYYPDGMVKKFHKNGDYECEYPNGFYKRIQKNGDRSYRYPNRFRVNIFGDGTIEKFFPHPEQWGGLNVVYETNGTVRYLDWATGSEEPNYELMRFYDSIIAYVNEPVQETNTQLSMDRDDRKTYDLALKHKLNARNFRTLVKRGYFKGNEAEKQKLEKKFGKRSTRQTEKGRVKRQTKSMAFAIDF